MSDPRLEVQAALFTKLSAILSGIATVADGADARATFPLVLIGEDRMVDESTKTEFGADIVHTLRVFTDASTDQGTKANKDIQNLIYDELHGDPPALGGGFSCWQCVVETGEVFRDPELKAFQGVTEIRFSL